MVVQLLRRWCPPARVLRDPESRRGAKLSCAANKENWRLVRCSHLIESGFGPPTAAAGRLRRSWRRPNLHRNAEGEVDSESPLGDIKAAKLTTEQVKEYIRIG